MTDRKDLQIRDPFIYPSPEEECYYLLGTTDKNPWNHRGVGFDAYRSTDLEHFEGPYTLFSPPEDFWGTHDFWAPELHYYHDKYYLFASFTAPDTHRGTQILASDSILGPFLPVGNRAATPADWDCLDGTLFIDHLHHPWMVFCHEWVQSHDGAIYAAELKQDFSGFAGEPQLLFRASEALWPRTLPRRDGSGLHDARVTDGPFLHRQQDGQLVMLWSSLGAGGYVMGCALSESGSLLGPWEQRPEPLVRNGGHGMLFRDFQGRLMVTFHRPNDTPLERFIFGEVRETPVGLVPAGKGSIL